MFYDFVETGKGDGEDAIKYETIKILKPKGHVIVQTDLPMYRYRALQDQNCDYYISNLFGTFISALLHVLIVSLRPHIIS